MLSGLDFDINVPSSDWLAWLRDLQYQRTTRFPNDHAQAVHVESIITPLVEGVLAHQEEHARLFFKSIPSSSPSTKESSSDMAINQASSASDDGSNPSSADASLFDMDASGPLEAEQRPQYSKAFGAAPLPSAARGFKQQHQQGRNDEPMFYSSSGYMDEVSSHNNSVYEDWGMPEDPYAARVPF